MVLIFPFFSRKRHDVSLDPAKQNERSSQPKENSVKTETPVACV